ncbi:MAG: hypothetical protein P1T08_12755 [Acidimicrobiia bacterium]|nr:hypothetical protein [Acidimicrobiia bacterium]
MGLPAGTAFINVRPSLTSQFSSQLTSMISPTMLKVGAAAGGLLAVGIGAGIAAFKIGETFDEAVDTIRVGTGATGEALGGLESDFKEVFKAVPTSAGDAATAIADLNTRTGATGEGLQDLAEIEIELARITGGDLAGQIASTTRLFGDWDVAAGDQAATLDKVFRASQSTGIGVGKLSDLVVQFGSPLRQMGFGLDESLALFGKFEKEGVNTEAVLGGMRQGLAKMARAGEEPADALARITDEIKNAGTVSEANQLAIETFGARAGPDMAAAIREGRFELGELTGVIAGGSETVLGAAADTQSFSDKWQMLKNRVLVALEPVATRVFDAIGRAMDTIGPIVDKVIGWFSGSNGLTSTFATVQKLTGDIFPKIGEAISSAMATIQTVVELVLGGLQAFWAEWGDIILGTVQVVWETIRGVIEGVLDAISGLFDFFRGLFTGDWQLMWDGIKQFVSGIWDGITAIIGGAFNLVSGWISGFWGKIAGAWSTLWTNVKTAAREAWDSLTTIISDRIDDVLQFFKNLPGRVVAFLADLVQAGLDLGAGLIDGILDGIKDIGTKLLDSLKQKIGGAIDGIKSFFGIGSPSKVTAALIGAPLGEGIITGLLGTSTDIGKAFATVTRFNIPDLALAGGGDLSASEGASPIGPFYIRSEADPIAIGREVAWQTKTSGI